MYRMAQRNIKAARGGQEGEGGYGEGGMRMRAGGRHERETGSPQEHIPRAPQRPVSGLPVPRIVYRPCPF